MLLVRWTRYVVVILFRMFRLFFCFALFAHLSIFRLCQMHAHIHTNHMLRSSGLTSIEVCVYHKHISISVRDNRKSVWVCVCVYTFVWLKMSWKRNKCFSLHFHYFVLSHFLFGIVDETQCAKHTSKAYQMYALFTFAHMFLPVYFTFIIHVLFWWLLQSVRSADVFILSESVRQSA